MSKGTILVADDDRAIRTVLSQALTRAGFEVRAGGTASSLWQWVSNGEGDVVVTDVMMPDQNAFDLIPRIKKLRPDLPIIVISAKNTLGTAITAAEKGAFDYLPKPANPDEIVRALLQTEGGLPAPPEDPMSADRVRWEHIQRVFEQCDRNVSETARRLKMHRRTLQRILAKHAPRR